MTYVYEFGGISLHRWIYEMRKLDICTRFEESFEKEFKILIVVSNP